MKKLFALVALLLIATSARAQVPVQQQFGDVFGFMPGVGIENGGTGTQDLNSATQWYSRGFRISDAKTLAAVRMYCTAKTGTPAATDIRFKLRAANTSVGGPAAADTEDDPLAATPTCPGWVEANTYASAISASTQFFIVMNNVHGTPASNFISLAMHPRMSFPWLGGGGNGNGAAQFGFDRGFSTDSGANWPSGNAAGGVAGIRLEFSDGTFAGIPIQTQAKDTTHEIYGTREAGPIFTTGADWPTIKARGISMPMNWSGTQPATLRFRIYSGAACDTLVGTTDTALDENIEANGWIPLYFTAGAIVDVEPNTTYCVTAGTVTGGSAGNAWNLESFIWDQDADSLAMLPWDLQLTYYNGTSFANSTTNIVPFALLLDTTTTPFDAGGGGGGGGGGGSPGPLGTKDIYRLEDTAVERRFPIYLVDATDGLTEETGVATTGAECRISKNGGASANCAGTFGENETGLYYYEPTAAEHNTLGYITVRIADAAARKFIATANVVAFDPTSGESFIPPRGTAQGATSNSIQLEATEAFGDDELNDNTAVHIVSAGAGGGQTRCICDYVGATDTATPCQDWETVPTAPIKYSLRDAPNCTGVVSAAIDLDAATGTLGAAQLEAGAINANALAADAGTELGTATWATTTRQLTGTQTFSNTGTWTGNVTGSVGSVTGNVGGTINGITATGLADLFDTNSGTTAGAAVAGSVVKEIVDNAGGGSGDVTIHTGTAASIIAPNRMRLEAVETYGNNVLNNQASVLILTSSGATGAVGRAYCIKSNLLANDEVTFTENYKITPAGTVTYAVIPTPNCNVNAWPVSP